MRAKSLLTTVLFWLTITASATGQSAQELSELGAESLPGDIIVYYAGEVSRGEAAEVQRLMEACTARYRHEIPDIPPVTVAILDSTTWVRLSPAPYGFPHHNPYVTPVVVLVPARPAAIFSDIGIDPQEAPRFFRLLALHELGHLLNWAAVGLDPASVNIATPWPVPGWYREFAADYFRFSCLPPDAPPRQSTRWLDSNRPLYPFLDESDRVHEKQTADGTPYMGTPAYWRNVGWVMGVIGEAARRHHVRLGDGFLPLLREQWKRSPAMTTDAVIAEMTESNPDLVLWLKQMGAIR